ncbi:MAG: hypothetical protein U1A77_17340 [Pirellulales bacterium]
MFLSAGGFLAILFVDWRRYSLNDGFAIVLVFGLLFVCPIAFLIGARLLRRDARPILDDKSRRIILYLRPFSQEDVTSPGNLPWRDFLTRFHLHPMSILGGLGFGLPMLVIAGQGIQSFGRYGKIVSEWILAFVPITTLVMCIYAVLFCYEKLRGTSDVTLEQELCLQLRHLGDVVAVGEPGEWLAPDGGARIYLDDDSWQAVVTDGIERARVVIVHLVPDGWTWWECCQVFQRSAPEKVLGIVAGDLLSDDSYGRLRQRMYDEFKIELATKRGPCDLIRFAPNWSAHTLSLRYIPWLLFPLVSYRLRRATLRPFLDSLARYEASPERIPNE